MFKFKTKQLNFGEVSIANTKDSRIKDKLALLSKGLMLPVAVLPIAGMLLGIGAIFPSIFGESNEMAVLFGNIISLPGTIVFRCLPILFAIAIAISFTKDAGMAGLSALISWIVFCAIQSAFLVHKGDSYYFMWYTFTGTDGLQEFSGIFTTNNIPGMTSLNTSVFGGIIIGLATAYLYNKFKAIQLPKTLGFFSGVRFIPIISICCAMLLGILFSITWPLIGKGLYYAGTGLSSAPVGLNSFVYMFLNRALLPFGLHHVISNLMNWTPVGGSWDQQAQAIAYWNGQYYQVGNTMGASWATVLNINNATVISGDANINYQLLNYVGRTVTLTPLTTGEMSSVNVHLTPDMIFKGTKYLHNGSYTFNPGQYVSGMGAFMMFCLPAAALAMLLAAPKGDNRKLAGSIVLSAGFVSFFAGITEPIEFTFLFLVPWMYWGFHAAMAGLICMVNTILSIYTPYGGHFVGTCFLDVMTLGIIQDVTGGGINIWMVCIIGLVFSPIYFFFFKWAIKRFDLHTPGRGGNQLFSKKDYLAKKDNKNLKGNERIIGIIEAYGGKDNITVVEACFTRLRVQVKNGSLVNDDKLKSLGAVGVVRVSPTSVQSIFGTEADVLKTKVKEQLEME